MAVTEDLRQTVPGLSVPRSPGEALAAVHEIAQSVRARAAATDQSRRVPDETIRELSALRLFDVVTPKTAGGLDLGLTTLFDATVALGAACGSTAWVYGVLAGHSWIVNLFPPQTQDEVRADRSALTATVFRLNGTMERVEGGFRLTGGEGRFCSGVDHASWVIVGNLVKNGDSVPEFMFFILPRSDLEIVDDWQVFGMRGTGSKTIRIADAFIPAHRAIRFADMAAGRAPGTERHSGPVFRLSFTDVTPFSIVGAPLGAARGAAECFERDLKARLAAQGGAIAADANTVLARLAVARAEIDAAIALVRADAAMIDTADSVEAISALDRARLPRNWAYAVQTARRAANSLFEVAGGSALYDGSEMQRLWRDANAGAQHFAFGWDRSMTNFGRIAAGIPPEELKFVRR